MTPSEEQAIWDEIYSTPPTEAGLARRLALLARLPDTPDPKNTPTTQEQHHEHNADNHTPSRPSRPRLLDADGPGQTARAALLAAGLYIIAGWHNHDSATGIRILYLGRSLPPPDDDDEDEDDNATPLQGDGSHAGDGPGLGKPHAAGSAPRARRHDPDQPGRGY